MSGGRTPKGGGGTPAHGSKGEPEEGGVWAFHVGNHTRQQPAGVTHGWCHQTSAPSSAGAAF